jgi:hypothetical protein
VCVGPFCKLSYFKKINFSSFLVSRGPEREFGCCALLPLALLLLNEIRRTLFFDPPLVPVDLCGEHMRVGDL